MTDHYMNRHGVFMLLTEENLNMISKVETRFNCVLGLEQRYGSVLDTRWLP